MASAAPGQVMAGVVVLDFPKKMCNKNRKKWIKMEKCPYPPGN